MQWNTIQPIKQIIDIYYNMDESQISMLSERRLTKKEYILYNFIHIKFYEIENNVW